MIRNKIFPWAVTALLFFSACEKDELTDRPDSGTDQHLPHTGEQFIVDYTVGNGETRSGETNEPDNRIKSILYLLYQDGTLVKKREIPLKSGETHFQFPMTRDNMSWEQREALKDTLDINTTYTAVFVANAEEGKTLLLDKMEGGETIPRPFSEICLQLPETAITEEDEMFYLFTQEILSSDEGADRDNPYNCPVMLQRVVSKTEFRRAEYSEIEKFEVVNAALADWYISWIAEPQSEDIDGGLIYESAKEYMNGFADDVNQIVIDEENSSLITERESLVAKLKEFSYWRNLASQFSNQLSEILVKDINDNPSVKDELFSSWYGFTPKVQFNPGANSLNISEGWKSYSQDGYIITLTNPIELIEDGMNTFSVYTFGDNKDETDKNSVGQLVLCKGERKVPFVVQKTIGIKGNQHAVMTYKSTMTYNNGSATKSFSNTVDLGSLIDSENISKALMELILTNVFGEKSQYGTNFESFQLKMNVPNLSVTESVNITGEWTVEKKSIPEN